MYRSFCVGFFNANFIIKWQHCRQDFKSLIVFVYLFINLWIIKHFPSPEPQNEIHGAGYGERGKHGSFEEVFLLQDGVWHSRSESSHGAWHILYERPHYYSDHTGRSILQLNTFQVACKVECFRFWFLVFVLWRSWGMRSILLSPKTPQNLFHTLFYSWI